MKTEVVIVDAVRTPIGKYKGALKDIRPDDLGAIVIQALLERNPQVPAECIDDVIFGMPMERERKIAMWRACRCY